MSESSPPPAPTSLPDDAFLPRPARRKRPRWWMRGLIAGGALAALLFGGCVIFSFFCRAERYATPAEVLAAAREITPLELPDGYEGETAEVVETPMFTVRKAIFRHTSGKGVIAVTQMAIHWSLIATNAEGLRQGLDQLAGDMRPLIAAETATRTVTIRGEPVEFELRAGQDALSSTQLQEVRGYFVAKTGSAELWWQAEESIWDSAAVDRLLNSLAAE